MTPARRRALPAIIAAVLIAAALALFLAMRAGQSSTAERRHKPTLLLLTSLPLVFSEDFSLSAAGSPALDALAKQYKVTPISATSPADLSKGRLLLMAHPLAQTAENLVALDEWVRGGGRVLLLADPRLEWPSKRPLGDPLRPPAMFMDTGLLGHWGLQLNGPAQLGPVHGQLAGYEVITVSPGRLSGSCAIGAGALVAECRIGKGRVTVIADADVLDVGELDKAGHNLDAILSELSKLER
jgi:hypothetical protein